MSIIAALLDDIVSQSATEISEESDLWKSLRRCRNLAVGLDPYLEKNTSPESDALRVLGRKTIDYDWSDKPGKEFVKGLEAEMLSGHVEGQFLRMMVGISGAKKILEIGVFSGYSVLAMAQALPEDGTLVACELDKRAADFASNQLKSAGHLHKIQMALGPAMLTLEKLAAGEETFDLVFIDADKPSYRQYVNFILDKGLVDIGGVLLIDNTLLQGQVYLEKNERGDAAVAIHDFNEYLSMEPRIEQVLIPLRDGVTLAQRVS